uniref:Uncharacterized protein n=1 Tax=Rhizophora mucronata TaxID=61149 RepID=A0A2P2PAK3_RHIMU
MEDQKIHIIALKNYDKCKNFYLKGKHQQELLGNSINNPTKI